MEPHNQHNNLLLVLLSIGSTIMSHITQANLSMMASIIAIIGGIFAIINYCVVLYDRFHKKKRK